MIIFFPEYISPFGLNKILVNNEDLKINISLK